MAYKHGLDLSDKKLEIGKTKMEFLGLVIFQGSVELQTYVLQALEKFTDKIVDRTQLQRFLGCLNYIRQFIKIRLQMFMFSKKGLKIIHFLGMKKWPE